MPPRPCNISLDPLIESLIVGVGWAWLVKRDVVCHYTYHPAHDDDEIRGIHPRCLKHRVPVLSICVEPVEGVNITFNFFALSRIFFSIL